MRIFIKIIISLFIFLSLFFVADYIFFQKVVREKYNFDDKNKPKYFIKLSKFKENYPKYKEEFRPIMNGENDKDSIVIFGCSYAFGYIFPNEETLSYIMSKYSTRPIYNRSFHGWGIQHMLYQLMEDSSFYEEVKKPKYVIYVLMDYTGHFERLYYTNFTDVLNDEYYFTYQLKNGKLEERKPLFGLYYDFALTRHIYNKLVLKKVQKDMYSSPNKGMFDFFVFHFKKANEIIKQKWGDDTKFIVVTFEYTQKEYWADLLQKEGIDVIDIAETIGYKKLDSSGYGFFEPEIDGHPNGKIWKILVPKFKEIYTDL